MKFSKYFLLSLLLLFSLSHFCHSQTIKKYEAEWKRVDELVQKRNLPKSALEEVRKIYAMAKKDKQEAQIIKSLIFITELQRENREENEAASIKEIENEIVSSTEPATSILTSLLADVYWRNFQRLRWKLYDRTNTISFNKDDINTWTAEDFHKKISELYLRSISKKKLLQQTNIEPFSAIIMKGNVRHLRPTLYDLLVHKALEYFQNDERILSKPAYAFEINDSAAFAPAEVFAAYRFTTKDSLSLHHKALLLYQELIAFHLIDPKPDALIDVDIKRIQFVYRNSVLVNKEELYVKALNNIAVRYNNNPQTAQAWYLIALYHEQIAGQYDPLKDTTHRYERIKAREILERIVKDSAVKTEGWANSYNLLKEINKNEIGFSIENVNVPGQPFRALVQYRNLNVAHLRIIKVDEQFHSSLQNQHDDKFWRAIFSAPTVRTWQQPVPQTNDMQKHAVEIKIDALPVGEYLLLISSSDKLIDKSTVAGARFFNVSNISYVSHLKNYFVLHRESGHPLTNAKVQVLERYYDYNLNRYNNRKGEVYTTNKNGFISVSLIKDREKRGSEYTLDITHENDRLKVGDRLYDTYYYDAPPDEDLNQKDTKVFFFTDRSLYRPGQTVQFKGIIIQNISRKENNIKPNLQSKIFLRSRNGILDSITVTTNEYGSFNGTFQLPQSILNGQFMLVADKLPGTTLFHVEEYKRPKFFVQYQKVEGAYKVMDKITVEGLATAYAGNTVDGAHVRYRIVRQPRFPYPWISWRWWLPPVESMEIANGETTTDKEGKFKITFTAIPDKKIDKKLEPVFDYKVYVDVTDINGETRSRETVISAGYKSILLHVDVPAVVFIDSLKRIKVSTKNMNGSFTPATVRVSIYELIPEQRLIRQRYWQQPDQFVMSKEQFVSFFPHDEYRNEADFRNWEKGKLVLQRSETSKETSEFLLNNVQFNAGYYIVEVEAKSADGDSVKDVRFTQLINERDNKLPHPTYLFTKGSPNAIEPQEKTTVQVGSSATNVFLIHRVDKGETPTINRTSNDFQFINLSNEKKTFDFSASEADRGGYGTNFFFVKNNRFYFFSDVIKVPWSNKELQVEFATFRDKTLPGSSEQLKIRIKGNKNEKVAAEFLASMYDASLDQFYPHNWRKLNVWQQYGYTPRWNGSSNFNFIQSDQRWIHHQDYKSIPKIYDRLITHIYEYRYQNLRRGVGDASAQAGVVEEAKAINPMSVRAPTMNRELNEVVMTTGAMSDTTSTTPRPIFDDTDIQVRKNFNETVFFFPELRTDGEGNIEFSFTMPDAVTRWKLQAIYHTKQLAFGIAEKEIITQKKLMVQPNAPRFLRQGDRIDFTAKIANLSDKEFTGQAQLELIDATTNKSLDGWFQNMFPNQYFTVAAGGSELVKFPVEVPFQFSNPVMWRIIAKSNSESSDGIALSDGEEDILPVLTNKILVTETLPLPVRGSGTRQFTFEKLLNSAKPGEEWGGSHHRLTVEFTSNPAWYAVQALPYLAENKTESADALFNRYYANALANRIVQTTPRIKQIFDSWKAMDTTALLSNLHKNEELKSALLEETPWVLDAKNEEQQKKNIAVLFNVVRMNSELKDALQKLKSMQSPNGGFVWFKGGPDDRYMTQYILTGIGHLKKLNAVGSNDITSILRTAIPYLDRKMKQDYDAAMKRKDKQPSAGDLGPIQIQYLYMRSFFPEQKLGEVFKTANDYYRKLAQQHWMKQSKYLQGMSALALHRTGDLQTPKDILRSLKETSITNEEQGMYWKDVRFGYSWFWWYAPVETQALLIEAFSEITNDIKTIDDLKTWLIKNKQTNSWRTNRATAEACYAMLLQGSDWLSQEPVVELKLGNLSLDNTGKAEAGTGYFKHFVEQSSVKPEMGNISVTVSQTTNQSVTRPSWGAVYWQYFQDQDKVTPPAGATSTPLQLNKKLLIEKNTDRGPVLVPITEGSELNIGDKVKVRIEIKVDRDMEYVHMKDMRASALEPLNVLSGYKWQGGLGYYENTKDLSTNFFFNFLRKGTYVFEYPLFVTHAGNFSNGITTIQSMYAPEFSAHSEGVRIRVQPPSP